MMKLKRRRRPSCWSKSPLTSSSVAAASLWFFLLMSSLLRRTWVRGEDIRGGDGDGDNDNIENVKLVDFYLLPRYGSNGLDSYDCTTTVAEYAKTGALSCLQKYAADICNLDPLDVELGGASCSGSEVKISGGSMGFSSDDNAPPYNQVQACLPQVIESEECLTQMQETLKSVSMIDYRSVFVYTIEPTSLPTQEPSLAPPTSEPTTDPTSPPTGTPSISTSIPSPEPTAAPTTEKPSSLEPSKQPSEEPSSLKPTKEPSEEPTTRRPSMRPTTPLQPATPAPSILGAGRNGTLSTATAAQPPISITIYPIVMGAALAIIVLLLLFAGRLHYNNKKRRLRQNKQEQQHHHPQGDDGQFLSLADPTIVTAAVSNDSDDQPTTKALPPQPTQQQNSPGGSSKSSSSSNSRRLRPFGFWDIISGGAGGSSPSRSALRGGTLTPMSSTRTPMSSASEHYITADTPGEIAAASGAASISDSETMVSIPESLQFMATVEVDNESVTDSVALFSTEEQPIETPTQPHPDGFDFRGCPPACADDCVQAAAADCSKRINPFLALYLCATSAADGTTTTTDRGADPSGAAAGTTSNNNNNKSEFDPDPSWNPDDNSVSDMSQNCEPFLPSPHGTSSADSKDKDSKGSLIAPFASNTATTTASVAAAATAAPRNRMVPLELPEMQGRRKISPDMQGRRPSASTTNNNSESSATTPTPRAFLNYI